MTNAAAAMRGARLPADLEQRVDEALQRAIAEDWSGRIWARDTSLWSADPGVQATIANRLGWLDLPQRFSDEVEVLEAFAEGVRSEGFSAAVVCGMGGSSLAPWVLAMSMRPVREGISVSVLDSTDPAAVRAATEASDPARTLYLIASKSGTTTESLAFLAHFWHVADEIHPDIPADAAGQHFVAISDPAPSIDHIPHSDVFREVFLNPPDVGGRYSALSYVGLVPAALAGLDLRALLDAGGAMAAECRISAATNPGLALGVTLGALAQAGRDKLTLVIQPGLEALGAWIEQLVAESTGKKGIGILPVDGEALGAAEVYGDDRVFVRIGSCSDAQLDALAAAGHPIIDVPLAAGEAALGAEFFRWEFATAVAGAVLGINPFDEPNVTESKDNTRRVLDEYRREGSLPADETLATDGGLRLIGDAPLRLTAGHDGLANELRRHLQRARKRGYFALQAYIEPTAGRERALREMATLLRDVSQRAVTVGFGPRFLHSTGQLHKGGPPTGCFLQLTAEHPQDLPIAGWQESFGTLIDAQAAGDFISLETHELPVARVDLGADPDAGLAHLYRLLEQALSEPLS